jgi:hypothetical protein
VKGDMSGSLDDLRDLNMVTKETSMYGVWMGYRRSQAEAEAVLGRMKVWMRYVDV